MPSQLLHFLSHPLLSSLCSFALNLLLDFQAQVQLFLLSLLLSCTFNLHHSDLILLDKAIFIVFLLLGKGFLLSVEHQLLLQRAASNAPFEFFALLVLFLCSEERLAPIKAAVNQVIELLSALLIIVGEERFVSAAKCLMRGRMADFGKVKA